MLGLIGKKIGMTQVFAEDGKIIPATVIQVEQNWIVNLKNEERDGYKSVVLGYEDIKESKVSKAYSTSFTDGVTPKRFIKEFRVDDIGSYTVGQTIGVELFEGVKYLDISGVSKGKGFQGVVKRHNFGGGRATHGSKFHRQNGSTGQCSYPSKVFKGNKRAGRMGGENVTVQNLQLVAIDKEKNVVLVKGAVPGANKSLVYLNKATKKTK
jgi:large subunit ribosomal protein L3